MYFLSKLCFLCLNTCKNLKLLFMESSEGILIQKQLTYCLPDIIDCHSQNPKYICSDCVCKLECFYTFKQSCLRNDTYLKSYFQMLRSTDDSYNHLSVKLTDIKYQNKQQVVSSDQILATVGSDDELQTGQKKYNITRIQEAVFESDELNIEEADIVVKKECLTSEFNADYEFYHEYVKGIKAEPIPSVSDVFVSSIEDIVHEDSQYIKAEPIPSVSDVFVSSIEDIVHEDSQFIKAEPIPSVSDVFVSSIEDIVHEDSQYSNSSNENNSTIPAEIKITDEKNIKENKNFQCGICKLRFLHKSNLDEHVNIHTRIKIYECTICKISLTHKRSFIKHGYIHKCIKRYKCAICNEMFTKKTALIQHENIHNDIKNFECLICNKKFMAKFSLTQHEKIHTRKSYECTICKKFFRRKRSLIEHENNHNGIENYECLICNEKFMVKHSLTQHAKVHTRVKNFNRAIYI